MAQRQLLTKWETRPVPWTVGVTLALMAGAVALLFLLPGSSLLQRLHWLGSGICAQLPTHSFYPGGQILPLCARNTGIYLGFLVTLLTLYASGRGRSQRLPRRSITIVLLCGVAAMAVDGINSLQLDLGMPHLYQPQNVLRLITGLLTGLALAMLGLPWLNRFFWREESEQRSVGSWPLFLLYLPALVVCFFTVTAQTTLVVYPIALLSVTGLIAAVSGLNLLLLVAIKKRDESFTGYLALLPYFGVALLCACSELLVLAQLKYFLLRLIGPIPGL